MSVLVVAPYEAPELACSADGTTFEILFLTNDAPKGLVSPT